MQASRLGKKHSTRSGFLTGYLPEGSLLRYVVLWALVPLAALLVLYLITDSIIMPSITRHGTEFPLPGFTGQRLIEARLTLEELNLNLEVASEEFSPGKERGTILDQFPIAGTKVKAGRTIKFVVSAGKKMIVLPDVAGLSVRQAMLDIETAGLVLGDITWAFSDTLPERMVVVSYPPAGSDIAAGAPVTLMVNRGRTADFTYVPKVIGLTLEQATALLEQKQLSTGLITRRQDDKYLPETVLDQSESEGSELEVGTKIDLVISASE
ncbi:MAG: PASTA domain-containing protein [bacterium]